MALLILEHADLLCGLFGRINNLFFQHIGSVLQMLAIHVVSKPHGGFIYLLFKHFYLFFEKEEGRGKVREKY